MVLFAEAPFVAGVVLSWSLAAPPGPANALIAHVSAQRGWGPGWIAGMGAITGDLVMFALMGFGVLQLVELYPVVGIALGFAGGALMAYFAWEAYRTARREAPAASGAGGFARNFVTVVTSPFNWAWWLTVGAGLFVQLGAWIVVGFFVGLVAWVAFWAALARAGVKRVARFREAVAYASAALLLVFAVLVTFLAVAQAFAMLR